MGNYMEGWFFRSHQVLGMSPPFFCPSHLCCFPTISYAFLYLTVLSQQEQQQYRGQITSLSRIVRRKQSKSSAALRRFKTENRD